MSKIEVNTIDAQCGSTITLGSSGKTVTLAPGASQSGFGRTGTVNWCTTAKTSPLTVANGNGYFINTSGGAITVTLPSSPSAGDIIALKDYANTWDNNNVTVARNGSKINGQCACATLDTESQSVTLIYVDSTKGWQSIQDGTSNVSGQAYITATGGTITTCGDYKIHTFTSDANFVVSCGGNPAGSDTVSYLVIAGGAGSGRYYGGGGGAGGYRESKAANDSYTASPLNATSGPTYNLQVSAQTYPVTVGGGGATGCGSVPYTNGDNGSNSVFSTITSAGGGGGAGGHTTHDPANPGGSGGGGHYPSPASSGSETGGTGNSPPVSPPQGNPGVTTPAPGWAGAGGGAGAAGAIRVGGAGATSSINGSPVGRAGGGAGGPCAGTPGSPQPGAAGSSDGGGGYNANGTANTGGGGGSDGGAGGSGIVIIRYKFQ